MRVRVARNYCVVIGCYKASLLLASRPAYDFFACGLGGGGATVAGVGAGAGASAGALCFAFHSGCAKSSVGITG